MTKKFILDQEDGTVAGGNKRGDGAVDLQMSRTANTQVALNKYSFIGGGRNNTTNATYGSAEGAVVVGGVGNTAEGNYVFIGGGSNNYAGGNDNFQVIVGGSSNNINASGGAFIGGGSSNSISSGGTGYQVITGGRNNVGGSTYTVISGGQYNTANAGSHATVVGGYNNSSGGQYSISGGTSNTASGFSSVALGQTAVASAYLSYAIGYRVTASGGNGTFVTGYRSSSSEPSTLVSGFKSLGYLKGQVAHQGGVFDSEVFDGNGQLQFSAINPYKLATLSSADTTVLSLDGTGTTNLIIPHGNDRAWNVTVEYIGVCTAAGSGTTAVGDVVTGTDKFRFKRVGGTSTIGSVTNIELTQDATMTSAVCTYAVGGSNDLQITFAAPTTANASTFRVVAKVSLVEVAW